MSGQQDSSSSSTNVSVNKDLSRSDDNLPDHRRRLSSTASIGSIVLEDLIEGAVMQQAHQVLGKGKEWFQSTTSTATKLTTSAFSTTTISNSMMENREGERSGM